MAPLAPAVAAIRSAVRATLGSPPGCLLVACSGGADSLALAAGTAFVAPRRGWRTGLVTVDHQLQPGSAEQAHAVAGWARSAGFDPVLVETVTVAGRPGGPEAAARAARYEALVRAATMHGAGTVLLGHTVEDQAETVLLALLRGAGPRGLAAMPVRRDVDGIRLVRPLLGVSRAQTRAACAALGLPVWQDPHNDDPGYRRVRARALLDTLAGTLGEAVVANLAGTARLLAADTEALDALAAEVSAAATRDPTTAGGASLAVAELVAAPAAIRTRVLRTWARSLGVPGSALSRRHVGAMEALVLAWRGQGAVHLPGGIQVARRGGMLRRVSGESGSGHATASDTAITDRAGLSDG